MKPPEKSGSETSFLYSRRQAAASEYFVMRLTGALLALMSLVLTGIVYISLEQNVAVKYHEILMITIATYTFTKIAMAVRRGVKHRKDPSPLKKEAADR